MKKKISAGRLLRDRPALIEKLIPEGILETRGRERAVGIGFGARFIGNLLVDEAGRWAVRSIRLPCRALG